MVGCQLGREKGKEAFAEDRKRFPGSERGIGIWGDLELFGGEDPVKSIQAWLLELYIHKPRSCPRLFPALWKKGTRSAVRWVEGRGLTQPRGTSTQKMGH